MGRCVQKGSRAGGDAHDAAAAAAPALHEALQRADDRNGGNDTGGSAGGGSSPLPLPLPRHTHRAAQSTSRPRSASQGAVPCLGAKGIVRGRCVAARSWVNRRAPQPRDPGLPHDRGLSDDLAPIRRPPSWQASPPPMPAGPSLFRACARSYPPAASTRTRETADAVVCSTATRENAAGAPRRRCRRLRRFLTVGPFTSKLSGK
ncbi:hypothetical protein HPB49_013450 [Dermacentor silvarum]|uniref:Uncharacterized protein n=1 Tax=Dermacentor silvarum TaxID=543639 RepID=A0ACB8DCQ7_DERSI|nr:hypothetical protein HPB49_013450 [Dermacentor silvarum]